MSGGDAAYSFSLTTFSRTGKLLQIEYALKAVQQGRTSLGIKGECYIVVVYFVCLYMLQLHYVKAKPG